MSKYYLLEVKLGARWILQKTFTRHTDALHHIKENVTEISRYPVRVVRVVRTTVFESGK